jgi:hypothetical protein
MLLKEIIPLCREKNPYMQNEELLTVEAGGTYSYHWALKGTILLYSDVSYHTL